MVTNFQHPYDDDNTNLSNQATVNNGGLRFLYLLYLFSASDIRTTVLPVTFSGLLAALSGAVLTTNPNPTFSSVMARSPQVFFYVWSNVFVFCLSNQRDKSAIVEDRMNKPWRPLPAGLLSQKATRRLLLISLPLTVVISDFYGALTETALQFGSTWAYNDLGGADEHFVVRNGIVAFGLVVAQNGALRVACGPMCSPIKAAETWSAVLGCIYFTTIHVSDFRDLKGDKARNRQTVPVMLGDSRARWILAATMCFWTGFCSLFWQTALTTYFPSAVLGLSVAARQVIFRSERADANTWLLWSCWVLSLYSLPLLYSWHEGASI